MVKIKCVCGCDIKVTSVGTDFSESGTTKTYADRKVIECPSCKKKISIIMIVGTDYKVELNTKGDSNEKKLQNMQT